MEDWIPYDHSKLNGDYDSFLSFAEKTATSDKLELLRLAEGERPTLNTIGRYYCRLSFFPDEEITEVMTRLGLSKNSQRWFIPIEDISEKLDLFQSAGFPVFKDRIIFLLHGFIASKIVRELVVWQNWFEPYNRNRSATLIENYIDRFKRGLHGKKKPFLYYRDPEEFAFSQRVEQFPKDISTKEHFKVIKQLVSGKPEQFFLPLIADAIEGGRTTSFKLLFFDFASVFMKDKHYYWSELDYAKRHEDAYFKKSFDFYKLHIVKKILNKGT